ncbi:hypothetical protein TEA_015926 [Camellia sinensis var. sinensis]|uniref:Endoglucanase n=1 Tax=Camellia sinensis var. sinensis TaxID=542762 RepID=A0A4S4E0E5_CAMSN|nr:hypothetical protein TEA_015926 [Camellia sinensis var. sinensis]
MARNPRLFPANFRSLSLIFFLSLLSVNQYSVSGHDYADALRKSILFFEGQRSGKLPPDQRVRWRRDSALHDGATAGVDLSGGYYDAGDNIKFGFPMAFTATLLSWSVIDFGKSMGAEHRNAVKAVKWATDYLLKATAVPEVVYVQVGDPYSDHNCWERPEDMDTLRTAYKIDRAHPGSDVAGETAAALAAASIVFRSRDPAYSRLLLDRAVKVFEFADKYRGAYSTPLRSAVCPFYCDVSGYQDELLWGAAWLHKASRRREYREYIVKNEVILRAGDTINEFGWDNKHAGINVLVSKEVLMGKDDELKSFQLNADNFICSILPGISHPQVQYSPGGLIFKAGGSNMQHVTSLSFLLLAYSNYLSHSNHVVPCGGRSASPALLKQLAKRQEVLMGKDDELKSFQLNADNFICSILPGISHPQVQYSPGGLIFKAGGSNMQHVTSLSFLLLAYSNYLSHSNHVVPCGGRSASPALLKQLAKRQVDYILGDNPMRMSYMVGYGERYPERIHHRGSSLPSVQAHPAHIGCKEGSLYYLSPNPNPNVLVGAVVGGPNSSDSFPDSRPFFQESEPTTYINAPLVGLLAYFSAHP